jgi:DNA-binding CsgD family transcriptional regulator
MRRLGGVTHDPETRLAAAEWHFDIAAELGDLSSAARELRVIAQCASDVGGPVARWRVLRCHAMLAQARGQFADARRYGRLARDTVAPIGLPQGQLLWRGLVANLCHHTGYDADSLVLLEVADGDAAERDWPLAGVVLTLYPAWVLTQLSRLGEARAIYRRLGPVDDWPETPHARLFTWALGIATAAALGASDDVVVLRDRLAAHRGHHVVNGRNAMAYLGPAELWLGVAAAHLGLVDDAVVDLEHAGKACAANGADGFRAEAETELATVLVRRSGPGDLSRARGLAAGAARTASLIGAASLQQRARAVLNTIDAHPSLRLTPREVEVARLVADRLTNREIAERLYLSQRTAQNHVQHILDKLDLRSRRDVAAWWRTAEMSTPAE